MSVAADWQHMLAAVAALYAVTAAGVLPSAGGTALAFEEGSDIGISPPAAPALHCSGIAVQMDELLPRPVMVTHMPTSTDFSAPAAPSASSSPRRLLEALPTHRQPAPSQALARKPPMAITHGQKTAMKGPSTPRTVTQLISCTSGRWTRSGSLVSLRSFYIMRPRAHRVYRQPRTSGRSSAKACRHHHSRSCVGG